MARLSQFVLFLTVSQMAALAATPSAVADPVLKLYDLRDLIGLIAPPPPVRETAVPAPSYSGLLMFPAAPATAEGMPKPPPSGDAVNKLMDRLTDVMPSVSNQIRLLPGLYAIEAEEQAHAQLHEMLGKIRALYAERYQVELVWFRVATEHAPSIGGEVTTEEPAHRHDVVVVRRKPTPLLAVTRYSYISGLQPIVAQGAVGYAPVTAVREEGLRLTVLVGAGREEAQSTMIDVTGDIREVAMDKTSGPLTRDNLEVELPKVQVHSIHAHRRVQFGKRTVLSVVDGFREGESIVLAATVRNVGP